MRSLLIGAGLALMLGAAAVALVVTGVLPLQGDASIPDKLLVIATADDADGAEVATFAFVLDREVDRAVILDTTAPATVAGTTAANARDAYPFGGGEAVARALASQTGGKSLPWLVLSSEAWTRDVDRAGGIEVDLPAGVSSYKDGELHVLETGRRRLAGREVEAVASALDFVEPPSARADVWRRTSAALSTVFSMLLEKNPDALAESADSTSLTEAEIDGFFSE